MSNQPRKTPEPPTQDEIRREVKARQRRGKGRSRKSTTSEGFHAGLMQDRAEQQADLALTLLPENLHGLAFTVAKTIIREFPAAKAGRGVSRTDAAIAEMRKTLSGQESAGAVNCGIARAKAALREAYNQRYETAVAA